MTFDLASLSLSDMMRCGPELRRAAESAVTMEECTHRVVGYFYDAVATS